MPAHLTAPDVGLGVFERLVDACPAPTLLVEKGGKIRRVNEPARQVFGRRGLREREDVSVRDLLGVGWLELSLAGHEGDADLVADLPATSPATSARGWRLRPEPIEDGGSGALVVFLEPPSDSLDSPRSRAPRKRDGFTALFGLDPSLLAVKEAAELFARTRLPILLLAETGTGKELLARAIHSASPRRDRPFVAINCGALSPHLLESELFGYAPGAFTGASREGSEGKIGAARGGTLFLDEVAEMPGPLQALLLRVLEDGTYYRVGDTSPRHSDIRLICATCRDLPRMVAEGAFRQDLFYRIDGACLRLPPLRERTDLAELTLHLLDCLAEDEPGMGAAPPIEPAAFAWLTSQPWPGNVRQLKTALQHALVLAGGSEIRREHLPMLVDGLPRSPGTAWPRPASSDGASAQEGVLPTASSGEPAGRQAFAPSPSAPSSAALPAGASLEELEAEIVRQAVERAGGNLSLAARQLGIARTTLYRRLRREDG